MQVDVVKQLDDATRLALRDLVSAARDTDGVEALSEQTWLHTGLIDAHAPGPWEHILAWADDALIGYAHRDRTSLPATVELVVHPEHRRRGVGKLLLQAARTDHPDIRLWAHGWGQPAQAFATSAHYTAVRELWKMERSLHRDDVFPTRLPAGFVVQTFTPQDGQRWLEVNAAAFADHPEQGAMTLEDLAQREALEWFNPLGFFLIFDERNLDAAPTLAAFHWTKVERGVGEVYVVGVSPSYQGQGLGKAATAVGLAHLRDAGLSTVTLYVEGDNHAAIATYQKLGFTRVHTDVMVTAQS